jgi:hypothetical protein
MRLTVNGLVVDEEKLRARMRAELRAAGAPVPSCPAASRRQRQHAQRQRRAAALRRKTNFGVSVTLYSLPISMKIDVRAVGRAVRDLGIALPVDIYVIPIEEQERRPTRNGYWKFVDGRHRISLAPALSAEDANRVIMHELAHAHQYERAIGEGRDWNLVAAASKRAADGDSWNSWVEREARAFADEFAADYKFAAEVPL